MYDPRLEFILASASPRRRELLAEAGFSFIVDPSNIIEREPKKGEDPSIYAYNLAWLKARTVAERHPDRLVLAADTICVLGNDILNKPKDRADAERMVRMQEGRDVEVRTAFVVFRHDKFDWAAAVERSTVHFKRLSKVERQAYLDSGQWEGKAGAYGVQDGDKVVRVIDGSVSNVVGLPIERLGALLEVHADKLGIKGPVPPKT